MSRIETLVANLFPAPAAAPAADARTGEQFAAALRDSQPAESARSSGRAVVKETESEKTAPAPQPEPQPRTTASQERELQAPTAHPDPVAAEAAPVAEGASSPQPEMTVDQNQEGDAPEAALVPVILALLPQVSQPQPVVITGQGGQHDPQAAQQHGAASSLLTDLPDVQAVLPAPVDAGPVSSADEITAAESVPSQIPVPQPTDAAESVSVAAPLQPLPAPETRPQPAQPKMQKAAKHAPEAASVQAPAQAPTPADAEGPVAKMGADAAVPQAGTPYILQSLKESERDNAVDAPSEEPHAAADSGNDAPQPILPPPAASGMIQANPAPAAQAALPAVTQQNTLPEDDQLADLGDLAPVGVGAGGPDSGADRAARPTPAADAAGQETSVDNSAPSAASKSAALPASASTAQPAPTAQTPASLTTFDQVLQQTQPHGAQSASAAHLTPQGKADGTQAQAGGFTGVPIATPVTEQISLQVRKALDDGNNRIRIKMQPASLGQVEVRMEVGHDGSLKAVVAADKHETFEWLQRDARSLERALQESGFKTDSNSLSFQYRGGEGGQQRGFADQQQRFEATRDRNVLDATVSITTEAPVRSSVATGRLDLSV